jgi:hypothetical protein
MPEEQRRSAKPDISIETDLSSESSSKKAIMDIEEIKLREALRNFDFDEIHVPVLYESRNGERILKFSEMFKPLAMSGNSGSAGKSRVVFLKRQRSGDQPKNQLIIDSEKTEDEMLFPTTGFHDFASATVNYDLDALALKQAEMEEFRGFDVLEADAGDFSGSKAEPSSFSPLEQYVWEQDILWDNGNSNEESSKSSKEKSEIKSVPIPLVQHHTEQHDSFHLHENDFEEQDDFRTEKPAFQRTVSDSGINSPLHKSGAKIKFPLKRLNRGHRTMRTWSKRPRLATSSAFDNVDSHATGYTWNIMNHDSHEMENPKNEKFVLSFPINKDFEEMSWLDGSTRRKNLIFYGGKSIFLDLNDKNLIIDDRIETFKPVIERTILPKVLDGFSFNLSNDESKLYLNPSTVAIVGRTEVQHAIFARDLQENIFKPHLPDSERRRFHRPYSSLISLVNRGEAISIRLATDKSSKQETKKFVPKKEAQLSSRDGRVILCEYIEERPSLLNKFGMASEVVTYYRQKNEEDEFTVPKLEDGVFRVNSFDQEDEAFFLGELRPGTMLSSLNNNMYAVPLFKHALHENDFLLVSSRSKKMMYIRDIPALYVVGQIQPKIEVPAPNSRNASKYMKLRLQVYIHRLLKTESKVQISAVADAFKDQSESAIRTELKEVAEFQRGGAESGWWIKKTGWDPPRDSELQRTVTPEEVCAYESMLAGEVYLADLGLNSLKLSQKLTSIVQRMPFDYPLTKIARHIEEELQITPWNWTNSFVWALQGLGFLKLSGPGNPCGKNQGFSYLKSLTKTDVEPSGSRIAPAISLTGTDKDLRSLPNNELKEILLSFGVSHKQIDETPRWKRVDLVREKATDAVLMGIDTPYARFARSTRNTSRAQRKQFKKDAQRIFNRHCEALASTGLPHFSDDENYSDDDDWAKNLEDDMEMDESPSPVRRGHSGPEEQDDQVEYQRFLMERERMKKEASAQANPESNESKNPRKKILKKKILKRTVTIFREDGNHQVQVSFIDDPTKVSDYLLDQQDGGKRFQDTVDILEMAPPPPAKKPRKQRTEPKKRRRKKSDGGLEPSPAPDVNAVNGALPQPSPEKDEKVDKDKLPKEPKKSKKRPAAEAFPSDTPDEPKAPKPSKKKAKVQKESPPITAKIIVAESQLDSKPGPILTALSVSQDAIPTTSIPPMNGQVVPTDAAPAKPKKPPKEKRCSACKQLGHSKTSKICPMRNTTPKP